MAIRKEDWDAINKAIADAIASLKPHGWRKALFVLREWGILGTVATIIIGLLGVAAAAWYQTVARIEKETAFQTKTEMRLDAIEKELGLIRGDLAKQSLINHASLPLSDFKTTLPELISAITTAKRQDVKVSSGVMEGLQQKLQGSADAPEFWPTAADFVSYRSQVAVTDFRNLLRPDLPNCTDRDPIPQTVVSVGKHNMTLTLSRYEHCRFALDSSHDNERINWLLLNRASMGIEFKDCLVTYGGGSINLSLAVHADSIKYVDDKTGGVFTADPFTTSPTLRFDGCLFQFTLNSAPPQQGQEVTRTILAMTGPAFQFKVKPATNS